MRTDVGFRQVLALGLTWLLLAAAASLHAQEISPGPEQDRLSPTRLDDERDMPDWVHQKDYPIWGPEETDLTARVIQAFPQNGAMFSQECAITLGWRGLVADFFSVEKYIVIISNEEGYSQRVDTGDWRPDRPTYILFFPPAPGRYLWRVEAYIDNGALTSSHSRYFTVMPEEEPW